MIRARHTLVDISMQGRERILADPALAVRYTADLPLVHELLRQEFDGVRVPGIVRREEEAPREGFVPLGFVSWQNRASGRLRVAAFAAPQDIVHELSPFALLASCPVPERTPCLAALAWVRDAARALNVELGVWGSAALELYTRLPYTHPGSDLDVLVCAAPHTVLQAVHSMLSDAEKKFALRIDAELALDNGFGIALKELFSSGRTVLGKSMHSAALLLKTDVHAALPVAAVE